MIKKYNTILPGLRNCNTKKSIFIGKYIVLKTLLYVLVLK